MIRDYRTTLTTCTLFMVMNVIDVDDDSYVLCYELHR